MFRRRNFIFLVMFVASIIWGPGAFKKWRWSSELRKINESFIEKAPLIDEYEYPRGGYVWKVTDEHIYYAYARSSLEKSEAFVACIDRSSKKEQWFKSYDDFRTYRFVENDILLSWNDKSKTIGNLELLDSTTGEVLIKMPLLKELRTILPHPKDKDILFIQYADSSFGCIQLSTRSTVWERALDSEFLENAYCRIGKIWVDQGLLEVSSTERNSNGKGSRRLLLDLETGEIYFRFPNNTYSISNGYQYSRDEISYYRDIDSLEVEELYDSPKRQCLITDSSTGQSYTVNEDWDNLVLSDLDGKVLYESNDRRGRIVEMVGGVLIWTSKSQRIFNVYDISSGSEWIMGLGFNFDFRYPGRIQVWGEYMFHNSDENMLYCRSRTTGRIIWQYPLSKSSERLQAHFLIRDNILYGISGARVVIFDLN